MRTELLKNIFSTLLDSTAREVGGLIGETLEVLDEKVLEGGLDRVFSVPDRETVLTSLIVREGRQDPAYLLFDMDLAIDCGGRLLLMPQDEIEIHKEKKILEEELLDSFSEIANIIAGVVNSCCQENSRKKLHFVKGDVNAFPPASDSFPFIPGEHTILTGSIKSDKVKPGNLQFIFPHSLFEENDAQRKSEVEEEIKRAVGPIGESNDPAPEQGREPLGETEGKHSEAVDHSFFHADADAGGQEENEAIQAEKTRDQKLVDGLLQESLGDAEKELAALLNASIKCREHKTLGRGKNDLLTKTKGKQVLTKIDVSGDRTGEGYILLPLKDAVFLGGALLLLPPESVTQTLKQGAFDGDIADAFGEVANILVSCFSNRFQKDFPVKLNFKKTSVESLIPSQVDLSTEQPFRAQDFYLISTNIQMENRELGPMEVLFPFDVLGLEPYPGASKGAEKTSGEGEYAGEVKSQECDDSQKNDTTLGPPIISLISQDQDQLETLKESLAEENVELITLSPESDLKHNFDCGNIQCAFLFIKKTNDLGFAQTIKVRAALKEKCPLIVAGPDWTRSKVLKALKYGANDILITPAASESIREKCQKHLCENQG